MASSSRTPYKVFISHAGEDKTTIAFPLREMLAGHGITAFVDEKDMPGGTWSQQAMITAMETADIAVVVLSPEFVAKKWPMKELLCFLRRCETPLADGRRLPVIIPLFYRLSIEELYEEPNFGRLDEQGNSLYRASRFFERMKDREPEADVDTIKTALWKLHDAMGVENYVAASNDSTSTMLKRRTILLNDILEHVLNAVRTISEENGSGAGSDTHGTEFRPRYHEERSVSDLVLDFHERDIVGKATTIEGAVLQAVLDRSESTSVISIQGIGGVGKTSILRGLSNADEVVQRFPDGIHLLSLGADATQNGLIEGLCTMVEDSGGENKSDEMRKQKNWKKVLKAFQSWFAKKECLFMVDDVWETSQITSEVVHELSMLNTSGPKSKLVFTTRSMEISCRAEKCFVVEPRKPESPQCRNILMLHSRTKIDDSSAEDNRTITEILRKCAGLPLFLKLAGRAVRALSVRSGSEGSVAYRLYSRTLGVSMQGLLNTDVDSYDRLASSLSVSLRLLDDRKDRWGFPVHLSAAEMHRRLSVLAKQSRVPMSMLTHLWGLRSEAESTVVAREFEQIALATLYIEKRDSGEVELLGVHDSLHEYALGETRREGEETLGHKSVLEGYGRGLEKEEECRAWWSRQLEADGYVHSHVCHHLCLSGLEDELMNLLLKPEWTIRCFDVCGILDVERDYALGIMLANNVHDDVNHSQDLRDRRSRRFEIERALKLISDATRLSCGYDVRNPRELCFQLYGRLKPYAEENAMIKKYLNRLEEKGRHLYGPWLRCMTSFLTSPGGTMTRIFYVGSSISCMIMSGDGAKLYCGCDDGNIAAITEESGEVLKFKDPHSSRVLKVELTSNGKLLYSYSADHMVKVWDTGTAVFLRLIEFNWAHRMSFKAIGNGAVIWTRYGSGNVEVWDLESDRQVQGPFSIQSGPITCMAALPDNEHFVSGGEDKILRVWSSKNGKQLGKAFIGHKGDITCVSVTPDGQHVVSGSADRTVRVWSIKERTQIGKSFRGHSGQIKCVAMSRDGRRVAAGSLDETIRVWDVSSGDEVCNALDGHEDGVSGVLFSPVDDTVISCSWDGTVRFWDLSKQSLHRIAEEHGISVASVTFTYDGEHVVSGLADHSVRIWDPSSTRQVGISLLGHSGMVTGVAVTSDCHRIVSISSDQTVRVWDWKSHVLLHILTGHTFMISSVSLTPSGDQAVTSDDWRNIRVWDLEGREECHFILADGQDVLHEVIEDIYVNYDYPDPWRGSKVFVTDDGLRVVGAFQLGVCKVWDLETRRCIKTIRREHEDMLSFSRKMIMELAGEPTLERSSISVSLNGREIWYCDEEENILLGILEAKVNCWALSPDEKTICAGLENGQLVFMKLEISDPLDVLASVARSRSC